MKIRQGFVSNSSSSSFIIISDNNHSFKEMKDIAEFLKIDNYENYTDEYELEVLISDYLDEQYVGLQIINEMCEYDGDLLVGFIDYIDNSLSIPLNKIETYKQKLEKIGFNDIELIMVTE